VKPVLLAVAAVAVIVLGGGGFLVAQDTAPATCDGRTATVVGTSGNDDLVGTPGPDVIAGLAGSDVVAGLGGDDVLCGGSGADWLRGGPGADAAYQVAVGTDVLAAIEDVHGAGVSNGLATRAPSQ
jgi:Ca2+-binding RTX toxin-like protein